MSDPLALIRNRREALQTERSELRLRFDAIDSEMADLEVAERVLVKLSGLDDDEEKPSGKPEGTPTVPEMIMAALTYAKKNGISGLEPKGMTTYIRNKWWSDVDSSEISSIAWRMWKRGQLIKDNSVYRLLSEKDEVTGNSSDRDAPVTSFADAASKGNVIN